VGKVLVQVVESTWVQVLCMPIVCYLIVIILYICWSCL